MSGQLYRPGVSCVDTAFSRFLEASEYDSPVDVSPVADDPYTSPPQTYPGCFGLPYQDHNYGAPPPLTLTPPPAPPPPPKENFELKEEIVVTSDLLNPPLPSMPPQPSIEDEIDDPTRCICDFIHDDGYMIQCDQCSVWQHIVCMGLDRDSIPDTYLCEQCHPRPVDRARAREFQIRKREFLKTLVITSHDSSATDTDPEEVNNRLKAYGLDAATQAKQEKQKQKMKVKKRKERANSRNNKKLKLKEEKIEKENTNKELNKKHKLMLRDFASKTALAKKEKLTKKIEKMRAERISKEMRDDKLGCEDIKDIKDDERIINTIKTVTSPVIQDENAQNPWDIETFNEWEQSYEVAKYNQYTTYVQEYLNSTYMNGHQNEIADLVTDGLRVQRCHIKDLKSKKKGLESSCNIPNGQPVIEVIGKVMTRHQYDKENFGQRQLSPFVFFYGIVFDLDLVIDASDYGNDARFIRRSCQPNAEVRHVVAGGQAHFITVATKDITEHTEITIPYDYDYKKWNFCVDCACLRNSCPISRYQKKRLRFQKLQVGERANKKNNKNEKNLKLNMKSPVKTSPTKSPVKSHPKTPEKIEDLLPIPDVNHSPITETPQSPPMVSPIKMVRRSQVAKQSTVSTQISTGRVRSISLPSQDEDSSSVTEPLATPEPATLRCSEVDTLASPEIKDGSVKKNNEAGEPEKKKMTREERKMEAIMKAFEKMEKRNARKASIDQHCGPIKEKEVEKVKVKDKTREKEEVKKEKEIKQEPEPDPPAIIPIIKEEVKEERVVVPEVIVQPDQPADPEVKEVVDIKEAEKTLPLPPIPPLQIVREKAVKGKKSKKAAARRRTRNYSGTSGPEQISQATSLDDSSSSVVTPTVLPTPSISCPVTPLEVPVTPPSFRFVKTKRHLMNEWYSEKVTDTKQPVKPLEVSVPDDSMFVTCLPSPRNSMDKLRRNSQSNGSRDKNGVATDNSVGSAKKRWLRQAMGEGSSESGLSSPVPPSGGMSPNPYMAMPSPCASPPIDFVTPLKKRRLARESLSRESFTSESPTPTPTPTPTIPTETQNTNYFSSLNETFETKMEEIRLKNGISSFFSTLKPAEEEDEVTESNPAPQSQVPVNETNTCTNGHSEDLVESSEPQTSHNSNNITTESCRDMEKDSADNSGEVNCSSSGNTGIEVSPAGELVQISNSENVSASRPTEAGVANLLPAESGRELLAPIDGGDGVLPSGRDGLSPSGGDGLSPSTGVGLPPSSGDGVLPPSGDEVLPSREDEEQTVHCEQSEQNMSVCDDEGDGKSAIDSEPDSSEGVCPKTAETPMEVECDSVSMETSVTMDTVTPSTAGTSTETGEVDSTESSSVSKSVLSSSSTLTNSSVSTLSSTEVLNSSLVTVVEPCDSCSSAVKVNTSVCHEQSRQSSNSSDKTCSSTSSTVQEIWAHRETSSSKLLLSPDKLSVVDSSTDDTVERRSSFSLSDRNIERRSSFSISDRNLQSPVIQESTLSVSDSTQNEHHTLSDSKNEVTNSVDDAALLSQLSSHHRVRTFSLNDSFSSNSVVTPEPSTYPNRHLKFLNDSNYSTEMTVDSTTHFLSSASSGNMVLYDSDSMDVSSASEAGVNGLLEDKRMEDSFSSFLDMTPGSCESSQPPKEKKKVSLQDYLKRKKDKPCTQTLQTVTPATSKPSSVSSTVTTPIKLTPPGTNLDKLQPLATLPSLPMFEKTERKEFKSSSDLLSPIFNRKEKQEEVLRSMSLSERLRQEFGLDDDIDTDSSTDNKIDQIEPDESPDIPPPPPPPPPQTNGMRAVPMKAGPIPMKAGPVPMKAGPVPNGNSIPPLMSLKPYHSLGITKPVQNSTNPVAVPSMPPTNCVPLIVPPPCSTPVKVQTPTGKLSLNSPLPPQIGNLLASMKSPAQLKTDLTASLAALKAQISKVQQQSLPNSPSPSYSSTSGPPVLNDQASSTTQTVTGNNKPLVYDYGHQPSSNFSRQNSYPSSSTNHFQTFSKASSSSAGFNNKTSPGYNRVSPRYSKVSPPSGSQPYNSQTFNNHFNNRSPPLRNQKPPSSLQKHSASVSSTSRKHKYS